MDIIQGALFARGYLETAICDDPGYSEISAGDLAARLKPLFDRFPVDTSPNEAQTEDDLIWPVLGALGWSHYLRQQNLESAGSAVPDGLLFLDEAAKIRANKLSKESRRYEIGAVIVESKRWDRLLDRHSLRRDEGTAPSTQMLRYLRRADDLTQGGLRWGILTNGAVWRLYWQGARSVSEQFLQIDLAALFGVRGDLFDAPDGPDHDHWLKVFALMFRRDAIRKSSADSLTFHQRALAKGRFHEEQVARSLSEKVFNTVFPKLAKGIAAAAPRAPLNKVREATLILLYRLLFMLYAEDRNLLPVHDDRYEDYALREKVREDIRRRKDAKDVFSSVATHYWDAIAGLSRMIAGGDASIGLPPYNGGLFDPEKTPLLADIRLDDNLMADVVDLLSFEQAEGQRRYINYRDLGVQQLGSIYERLLEFELTPDPEAGVIVRPNPFARKSSGSYYTPDDLVQLILRETLDPLVEERLDAFRAKAGELADDLGAVDGGIEALGNLDPAEAILTLRVCDPAMGSGHFLVNLVDYLADRVIGALAEAEALAKQSGVEYVSPLGERIAKIRRTVLDNAARENWTIDESQLDDRHIIRRMVLKRCVYGVDKNPMAVELAKVSLWLHTFTVGAPLSFLDHHLRCGDSLFGAWAAEAFDSLKAHGLEMLIYKPLEQARGAAAEMRAVEGLTDAEIAEAHRSQEIFDGIVSMTRPLDAFLKLLHAMEWLSLKDGDDKTAVQAWLDGQFGDPVRIAEGSVEITPEDGKPRPEADRFAGILDRARALIAEERFLNWEIAFPGVWRDRENGDKSRVGGFDAIIGNPPWDRYEFKEVHWFKARDMGIAHATSAAERKKMIKALKAGNADLWREYRKAADRVAHGTRIARQGGDYPLLSGGKLNIYKLFVERGMNLLNPEGMLGLLTPSGIASDKTAARFFRGVSTSGRLKGLFDFENRKVFFPEVHASQKFCAFIAGLARTFDQAKCAFFLQAVEEVNDDDRCFPLTAEDFALLNPNTGTAPILRSRRDADLTKAVYARLPVLVDRSGGKPVATWPVRYYQMINMTSDSGKFRTRARLETEEGAWRAGGNVWESAKGRWLPLYEGKMVQAFDHRAASVVVNPDNPNRPAQEVPSTPDDKADPDWAPLVQYWMQAADCDWSLDLGWLFGFKDVTATTNVRTMIASFIPSGPVGNTLPVLLPAIPAKPDDSSGQETWQAESDRIVAQFKQAAPWLLANLNAIPFDFIARQKVQAQHLNWFIVEQLPVIPPDAYAATKFGPKTAAEIVRDAVLKLTYTAHDMAPFARDMGHVDAKGEVLPPFPWDEACRLRLRAKLDAVYFHLYGIFDPSNRKQSFDDIAYIYSTFTILEREETKADGRYLSRKLALAYCNALAAGKPDAEPEV